MERLSTRTGGTRVVANAAAILFSVLGTLLVVEAAARLYLVRFAPEPTFINYASLRQLNARYGEGGSAKQLYSPHRYLGYYPTPNYRRGSNRHNSLGYRGAEITVPKPAGEIRIACLGGSTTYDSDIADPTLAYPAQLEAVLHERGFSEVTVINAGAAGWTSWESLINFELRVLDLEPDVVIFYEGINDVHPRFVWPPARYLGDNSGYRAPNQSGIFMPSLLEYSTLARGLMIRAGWATSHADLTRTIDRLSSTYYGDAWRDQIRRGDYPDGIFREVTPAQMLESNGPIFFARNLRSLLAIAAANDVRVLFASFAYSPDFPEEPRVTAPEYRAAIAQHNTVLRQVADASGASFFDFAGVFPTDRAYFTDGRHNNQRGARLKAELFADYLAQHGVLR